jgi:hypothetical protein
MSKKTKPNQFLSVSCNSVFEWTKCPSNWNLPSTYCSVWGGGLINESNLRKWCLMFNQARVNVHNEKRSWRPSLIIADLKNRIAEYIRTNGRFSLYVIHEKFYQISRLPIHEIVAEHLHYRKICARRVPRILTVWRFGAFSSRGKYFF